MNILIVDGNEKNASNKYIEDGMLTQYNLYEKTLRNLITIDCNITIIHPACNDNYIPKGISLDDFHGIVWTGSLLNIYNSTPPIERQIELAKELFKRKNKIFGSCWGLQVLAKAAGGNVRKNPKGLEAVVAKNILINNDGMNHPIYRKKPIKFDSFCWHYDEVDKLPLNAKILSYNEMSDIQSFTFSRDKSEIWAVQYHPEFDPKWIAGLMKQRKSKLLEEGIYSNSENFYNFYNFLSDTKKYKYLKTKLSISDTLINSKTHTLELANWIQNLKNNI